MPGSEPVPQEEELDPDYTNSALLIGDKALCLTIPCKVGKKGVEPKHIHIDMGNGVADSRWECIYCHLPFHRRKPARMHMGLVPDKKASCPVLRAQDEKRRATLR